MIVAHGFILQIDAPTSRWSATRCSPTGRSPTSSRSSSRTSRRSTARSPTFRATACACMCAGATTKARTTFDVALDDILPRLYQAKVGALMLSMANPGTRTSTASSRARQPPQQYVALPSASFGVLLVPAALPELGFENERPFDDDLGARLEPGEDFDVVAPATAEHHRHDPEVHVSFMVLIRRRSRP